MFENNGSEHFIVEVTDEDMQITEKWLVKVSYLVGKEDGEDSEDGLISRKLVYELIQRFAPGYVMVLGFEVAKLPVLYLSEGMMKSLDQDGKYEEIVI